jgi:hypothetical protein
MKSSAPESALGNKIPPSGYRNYIPAGGFFVARPTLSLMLSCGGVSSPGS